VASARLKHEAGLDLYRAAVKTAEGRLRDLRHGRLFLFVESVIETVVMVPTHPTSLIPVDPAEAIAGNGSCKYVHLPLPPSEVSP